MKLLDENGDEEISPLQAFALIATDDCLSTNLIPSKRYLKLISTVFYNQR